MEHIYTYAPIEVLLGETKDESLHIYVLERQFPDNNDYWDGNWLVASIQVSVGPFQGKVQNSLRTQDFIMFQQELVELYNKLTGTARFSTIEGWLEMQLVGDGLGHIVANCALKDGQMQENKLVFKLYFDQTYIPDILKSLSQVTQAFPLVGQPS